MKIGIIAALPGELKPLVKGWERKRGIAPGLSLWRTERKGDDLVAVCGGMGSAAATRSFAEAERGGALDIVLSVGWAGALNTGIQAGECYVPSEIIDAQTGESYCLTDGKRVQRLVTTPTVADATEKKRLCQSYGAVLVDMEAAAIARLANMRGIPICCFKAVSDEVSADLPNLNPFIGADGHMRMASFLAYVAVRPRYWRPLARLGGNSSRAAKSIASKVYAFLEDKDVEGTNRTGAV